MQLTTRQLNRVANTRGSLEKEKAKLFFAWLITVKNYCKGASINVPANRSISIR
jgi:hypothetical protein